MADDPGTPDPDKPDPEKSPFVINLATFTKGFPFETRKGAFHSYTYIPFLGWLDPIALNLIIFVVAIALIITLPILGKRSRRLRAEKTTVEGLTALRASMSQFNEDTAFTPVPPEAMVRVGRLAAVPKTDLYPYHDESDAVLEAPEPNDAGGWRFDRTGGDPARMIFVNCTHTDRRGKSWFSY